MNAAHNLGHMAIKGDLERMATKDDLKGLASEEFVERVFAQASVQMMNGRNLQTRWFAGIFVIQTIVLLAATIMIVRAVDGG